MKNHCKANPCCGDPYSCEVPLPQHRSGLWFHNSEEYRRKADQEDAIATTEARTMADTKILYIAVPRGHDRVPVVSQKEWATIFAEYPDSHRYHAANLAAHNWDVVMIEGRILIASPWGGGHWIDKDGSRTDLTEAEFNEFYPVATDPKAQNGEEYTRSGGVLRHRRVHLPAPPSPQPNVTVDEAEELSRINAALEAIRSTCFTMERDDRQLIGRETLAELRDAAKLINELVWKTSDQPAPQMNVEGVYIPRLPVGTPVTKVLGYPFPGIVVATFHTLSGQERFVVEATGGGYRGMLHIFNGDQLRVLSSEGQAE